MSRTGSEKIYRLLCFLVILTAALIPSIIALVFVGIIPVLLLEAAKLPDAAKIAVMILLWLVLYGLLTEFLRRILIKRDVLKETESYSRWQSIGIWLTPGFLLWLAGFILNWHLEKGVSLWLFPAGFLTALLLGIIFPFRRHVNTPVFGCLGPLAAFLIFLSVTFFLGKTGKPLDYTGDKVSEIPHLQDWQRKDHFPAGVSRIKVRGRTTAYKWECSLSEKDFQKYMKKCPFPFRKCTQTDRRIPVPFYEYERRARNGGGISLRYSVPEEKFYGNFSDH